MQLKSLTLTALALFFINSEKLVHASTVLNDVAIVHGEDGLAPSYLSVYGSEDEEEVDFVLSSATSRLSKRDDACIKYHTVSGSDSCVSLAAKYGVSLSNIYSWNPQIQSGCPNLNNGKKYCVAVSSTSSSVCSKTHQATNSDNCVNLAKSYGLTLDQFYDLNPSIDSSCSNLNTGSHYCVKANDGTTATTTTTTAASTATSKVSVKSAKKSSKDTTEVRKKLQTGSDFTYYWIAQEDDYDNGSKVAVKTCSGSTIGHVSEDYADALVMEGTGVVGSKIINLGACDCNGYKCFELVNKHTDPYGLTSYGSALRPYITVASNDIPKNTKIYVPALVGWELPGSNKKHNGCLLVDDQSWSFKDKHIDFYVYSMSNYESLDKIHKLNSVDIYEGGSCKLLNYDI